MAKQVIKISSHLPAIPDWLKLNSSIKIPLPLKRAKELASKLSEVQDDVEIEISFVSGKKTDVEITYQPKKE